MIEESTLIPFLNYLAKETSAIINPLFANPDLKVEWKADQTPVTYADKKTEEWLRSQIAKEFPKHGIIGEEFGQENPDAEFTWVLDPIDGTRAFTAGSPHFGTLVALCQNQQPIWGMIHLSVLNRCYIGNGNITTRNGSPVRVSENNDLQKAFLLTTDPKNPNQIHPNLNWNNLVNTVDQFRSWGDCFGYTLIIEGKADIMCDPILNYWDLAALLPVVTGAGATATDWYNQPTNRQTTNLIVANPTLHQQTIHTLQHPKTSS